MVGGTQSAEPRTSTDLLGPMSLENGATPFQVRSRRGQESALLPTPEVSPLTQTLARLQPYAESVGEPMLFGIPRYLSSLGVSAQSAFDPQDAQASIDRLLPMLRLERPEQLIGGQGLLSKLGTGFGLASQAASQLSALDLLRKAGMGLMQGLRDYGLNNRGGINPVDIARQTPRESVVSSMSGFENANPIYKTFEQYLTNQDYQGGVNWINEMMKMAGGEDLELLKGLLPMMQNFAAGL